MAAAISTAAIPIEHFYLGTVSNVDAASSGIHRNLIEVLGLARCRPYRRAVYQTIAAAGRACHSYGSEQYEQNKNYIH